MKYLAPLFILLLLSACSENSAPSHAHMRFQSVSPELAQIVQEGDQKMYCSRCGMKLPMFYKTNHAATHDDSMKQYCSIHCLVEALNSGHTLKNPKVVDLTSLKFIDASKAYYVVGSSKPATMSRVSKYGFLDENDAKAFAKEFGGEVMDMYQAIEITQKDFRSR